MKLKSAILTAVFFVFGVSSSVHASDVGTPDILSSVSPGSVQTLTKAESAELRGEYWESFYYNDGSTASFIRYSSNALPSFEVISNGFVTRRYLFGFYVSR